MASYEGCHAAGPWLVICIGPDVCNTPLGATMVPVPYGTVAFGTDSTATSSDVNFHSQGVFHSPSFTLCCVNNEPGVGGGVQSGVNKGVCYEFSHSNTVNVDGQPVIRDGDLMWMNARNRKSQGNAIGLVKYVSKVALTNVLEATATVMGATVWAAEQVGDMVDPRLTQAIRQPAEPLTGALDRFWEGFKSGAKGGASSVATEEAGALGGSILDTDVFTGRPVGKIGANLGRGIGRAQTTASTYDGYMDLMANGKQAQGLGYATGNVFLGYIWGKLKGVFSSKVRISGRKKGGPKPPSAKKLKKAMRKRAKVARRANRPK